jgi:hypothetical protein
MSASSFSPSKASPSTPPGNRKILAPPIPAAAFPADSFNHPAYQGSPASGNKKGGPEAAWQFAGMAA